MNGRLVWMAGVLLTSNAWLCASDAEWQRAVDAGDKARTEGKWDKAETAYFTAMQQAETFPEKDLRRQQTINLLASATYARGKMDDTEALYLQAIEWSTKVNGPEHPTTIYGIESLGWLLNQSNTTAKAMVAEKKYRHALALREKLGGVDSPERYRALFGLIEALRIQKKFEDALPLAEQSVVYWEKFLPPEHTDLSAFWIQLGQIKDGAGKADEAEALFRKALKSDEENFGENHPVVARDLTVLAASLRARKKDSEAKDLEKRALSIEKKMDKREH